MMNDLQISDDFSMPIDAVTQTFGILANRGSGKSYAAMKLAEEMMKAGQAIVVIDPTGAWWGLRSSADGQSEGLPIIVFGGEHADLPLKEGMGERLAQLVVEKRFSCILDVSEMYDSEQYRLLTAFAKELYHLNRAPLHLFIDECHSYIPQKPMREQNHLIHAMKKIIQMGRVRGLGVTLISQRAAVINKDVLNLIQTLVVLRTIAPRDREAVREWVSAKATADQEKEFMDSLPSLKTGEAWFWSPEWLNCFERIQIAKRETFDSSATPRVGARVVVPLVEHRVDVKDLAEALEVEANSPTEGRVRQLEQENAELRYQLEVVAEDKLRNETSYLAPEQEKLFSRLKHYLKEASELLELLSQQVLVDFNMEGEWVADWTLVETNKPDANGDVVLSKAIQPDVKFEQSISFSHLEPEIPANDRSENGEIVLGTAATNLLNTLADYFPMWLPYGQLATLSNYSMKSGSFTSALAVLRRNGVVDVVNKEMRISDFGFEYLGRKPAEPKTPKELRENWLRVLPTAERNVLKTLLEYYPQGLNKESLAEFSGYSVSSGSFTSALATLRRNQLLDGQRGLYRAHDNLFERG